MPSENSGYWFPAQRYGWGWGTPRTWQGWAVLVAYTVVIGLGAVLGRDQAWQIPLFVVATAGVFLICLKKGEPTRWRWGGDR